MRGRVRVRVREVGELKFGELKFGELKRNPIIPAADYRTRGLSNPRIIDMESFNISDSVHLAKKCVGVGL